MIFYITNAALDITAAIGWWILKTTGYLVYGGITYIFPGSNDEEKDYNRDGIPDYLQWEQLQQKVNNESRKIDIEEFKLGMEERKVEKEQEFKMNDSKLKLEKEALDRQMKDLEMQQKERLEAMKIKAIKDKNKSK